MNTHDKIFLIAAAAFGIFLAGCSSTPTDLSGGTLVGNPAGVAAVRSFKAFRLHDRWCLSTYLPGGRGRLDPASVISRATATTIGPHLAKVAATASPDTLYDTLFKRDTSVKNRDLIKPETTVVKDTLFEVVLRRDTTDTLVDSMSSRVVTLNTVTDSFYVNDTVVTSDTLQYQDTIVAVDTVITKRIVNGIDTTSIAAAAPSPAIQLAGSSSAVEVNYIQFFMEAASVSYIDTLDSVHILLNVPARLVTDSSVVMVNKTTQVKPSNVTVDSTKAALSVVQDAIAPDSTPIHAQYTDADGDGGLFTARAGSLPRIALSVSIAPPAGGSQSTDIMYSSGSDGNVRTVENDIVQSLSQTSLVSGGDEVVTYLIDTVRRTDTAIVTIQSDNPTDSIECVAATYTLVRDPDSSQAFDGRLSAVRQTTTYRIGQVHRVDVSIELLSAAVRGLQPERGLVTATVDLVDGTQDRLLDGRIDLGLGVLEGTWIEGKSTKAVSLDSLGRAAADTIIWQIP